MTENHTTLATFYKGWEVYQEELTKAIAPLSPDQLALLAAPHLRSIGVLAAHIISARVWWFQNIMGEGNADLAPMVSWDDDDAPARTASELVPGLEATWNMIDDALNRWTPTDLEQRFQRRETSVSRQWIIWHIIEHDLHHGGELSYTLGIHGLAAPDL
jgi:uncharacterized damage-inducible protein DinB